MIIFLSGSTHSFIQIIVTVLYFELHILFFCFIAASFEKYLTSTSFNLFGLIVAISIVTISCFVYIYITCCTTSPWPYNSSCPICKKSKTHIAWCQECGTKYFKDNFDNWTSGNQQIDEIIKETQMNSKFAIDFVEWIPYEQLEQIEIINHGGFGTIYSAVWKQGPLCMNLNKFRRTKKILRRTKKIQVALKGGISTEYLKELCMHIKCCTTSNLYENSLIDGRSPILRCYGLTKRPISEDNGEYMLVIQFAKGGDLKTYLSTNFKQMKWFEDKLPILAHIAYGLKIIHKEGLIHRDLHYGNILINNNISYISDFGLSHPYNQFKASDKILLTQNTKVVELPTIQNTQDVEPPMMQNTFDTSYSLIDTSGFP
ncbi:45925_t:CDS:2, partial [Gigaspora margarita]